ncbi:ABC transporter ATP-binding protein [Spiroplasma litorale]|uniref:ABC transporter ATP-binding protein n=2 Tax=Spiroplasma litorale TaxID=216942 RepID=A0A0K1W2T2_9MOLU|nr:ABC transporter ATP-binding protein [Spiroplasma litorale]
MIFINKINKTYGSYVANKNISIKVEKGLTYGILGTNGAGKTTLINQVMGFIKSDSGDIKVHDNNPWKNRELIMDKIGFVAGEIKQYQNLKSKNYIKIHKDFIKDFDENYYNNLINLLEINLNTKIKNLSKGNKQKLELLCALMKKPEILVLDEPTSGLDPVMQNKFYDILKYIKQFNVTIFICSHIFQEIKLLCDKVSFINSGSIIKEFEIDDNCDLEDEFNKCFGNNKNIKNLFDSNINLGGKNEKV